MGDAPRTRRYPVACSSAAAIGAAAAQTAKFSFKGIQTILGKVLKSLSGGGAGGSSAFESLFGLAGFGGLSAGLSKLAVDLAKEKMGVE